MIPFIYHKRPTFKRKKQIIEEMIIDFEIEIETMWMMYKKAQAQFDEVKAKIQVNLEEIDNEKAKPQMDLKKIKMLQGENFNLGFERREGKEIKYHNKGQISQIKNQIEHLQADITQKVFQREYLKLKLQATNRLLKKGSQKDFEKFRNEELIFTLK